MVSTMRTTTALSGTCGTPVTEFFLIKKPVSCKCCVMSSAKVNEKKFCNFKTLYDSTYKSKVGMGTQRSFQIWSRVQVLP